MMSEVARETFWRVQRFSTDWHANSFAGATVRKLSRGMWAFDMLNDTVLMALWPSLVVLVGATFLFGWHWPLMGLAVGVGTVLYVLVTVKLSLDYVTPATRRSNAWDSRLGGALADAVSCNPCRQGVRRGRPRGRALWPRPGALADAHLGHLDQGHAHRHPAAGHPDDAARRRDRPRAAVLVAGRRHAGRRHLRAHGLWRDQRLPARHRPPCAQRPAVDQRPGGARRLP